MPHNRLIQAEELNIKPVGLFSVWTHTMTPDEAREWYLTKRLGVPHHEARNTLMATFKERMSQAVYPLIERLVITNQTSTPVDNETSFDGVIYQTSTADEFSRSGPTNPFVVAWNIPPTVANGAWGSFVTIDAAGNLINRALAGYVKRSGESVIVEFTGRIV